MRKTILIVDWALLLLFIGLVVIGIINNIPLIKIVTPIFMIFIVIHIIQHWKTIMDSLKGKSKSKI